MSAPNFRSVFMVASCAGAVLSCYLVSLRVASERAALEQVETQIVMAERDIRLLQTEIGTRGRLAQLERWNAKVLALSAPSADQFLEGSFALARLTRPQRKLDFEAPVVLASAPAPQVQPMPDEEASDGQEEGVDAKTLLHQAGLKRPEPATIASAVEKKRSAVPKQADAKNSEAAKKAVENKPLAASKTVTKATRTAKVDPLAPLPARGAVSMAAKDSGTAR